MLRLVAVVCVVLCAYARYAAGDGILFNDFKDTYNRQYSSQKEELKRFQCFQTNLNSIDKLNAMDGGAQYGINAFADLCADEFKATHHNLIMNQNRTYNFAETVPAEQAKKVAASSVDWRTQGAVTHVKNQGQCGSCWSFSTTGNLEGQYFRKTGKLLAFSEEELVQCSHNGNMGCQGGLMDDAFDWVKTNGGIATEANYPYTSGSGTTGTCNTSRQNTNKDGTGFTGHQDIAHDEDQMAAWVAANGPLSIAVDAGTGWQLYAGGIKKSCLDLRLDHGVLIVGFGADNGVNYWIVKNSWGATWGEQGYIRLERGKNCNGLKNSPSTVTM